MLAASYLIININRDNLDYFRF